MSLSARVATAGLVTLLDAPVRRHRRWPAAASPWRPACTLWWPPTTRAGTRQRSRRGHAQSQTLTQWHHAGMRLGLATSVRSPASHRMQASRRGVLTAFHRLCPGQASPMRPVCGPAGRSVGDRRCSGGRGSTAGSSLGGWLLGSGSCRSSLALGVDRPSKARLDRTAWGLCGESVVMS